MTIEIWHNSRCRKSREGLKFIEDKGLDYQIRNYLDDPPSVRELEDTLKKMGLSPRDIIRKKEKEYKELGLNNLDIKDSVLIKEMSNNPKLIERPIVIKGNKAVLGRPIENLESFLS